ncbi:MAG: type II CAAX prenyl endopeptidase Rce1 family protein, partial [Anaerolineae bacterium]
MFNSENRLLVQARSGRWLPPVWVVIPLAFLMPLISSLGGAPALVFNVMRRVANPADLSGADAATIMRLMFPQTPLEQVVYLTTSFGGVFVLLWLWVALVEKRPFRSLGLAGKGAAARFGLGLAGGGLAFGSVVGLLYLAGGVTAGAEFWQPEAVAGGVLVLFGWLVQGPAEELVFRGWMLPVVSARYGVWPGALLSAAAFAALHSFNPGLGMVAALNLGLFGLFAALYAL